MASEEHISDSEKDVHIADTEKDIRTSAYVPTSDEEETDTVLLDVGAAHLDNAAYNSLKLAKDGHVRRFSCTSYIKLLF